MDKAGGTRQLGTPPRSLSLGPALSILELDNAARGIAVADALSKRARVDLFASRPVSGGKHLLFFRGPVAEVEESYAAGVERAADALVDRVLIPMLHEQLWSFLPDPVVAQEWTGQENVAAAIVETRTVASAVRSADAALKEAPVVLRDMRLAVGYAGRALFTLTGEQSDVEASLERAVAEAQAHLVAHELIAAPAGEIVGRLIF